MSFTQETVVVSHRSCPDGFGAAWAAWKKLGDAPHITYKFAGYGDEPIDVPLNSVVYLLDFSYPRDILLDMANKTSTLRVLDHHKTAEANLFGLPFAEFDMNSSGATMAWRHFHPHKTVPELLRYVEDRDLWKWERTHSEEINAALYSYPREFKVWSHLADVMDDDEGFNELVREGNAILRAQARTVDGICYNARLQKVGDYTVPVVNATALVSEVGHRLLELYPGYPFSASYRDQYDRKLNKVYREWSLRGRGDVDVSEVAKSFGGGGHSNAAGFRDK